jgi:hypothetical protein
VRRINYLRGWTVSAVGLLIVVGLLAGAPGNASAAYYCNIPVGAWSPCNSYVDGRWSRNTAHYQGAGTVGVCEKTVLLSSDPALNGYVLSRICANNLATSSAADSWSWLGYNERAFVINNSRWTHTILAGTDPYGLYGYRASAATASDRSERATTEALGQTVAPSSLPRAIRSQLGALREASSDGRIATLTRPDDRVSLRTTADKLCLSSAQAGGEITCQRNELAIEGQLVAAAICGDDLPDDAIAIFGVVPDDVNAVKIVDGAGKSLGDGIVSGNTFRVQVPKTEAVDAAVIEWAGKKGAVSLAEIVPDDLGC